MYPWNISANSGYFKIFFAFLAKYYHTNDDSIADQDILSGWGGYVFDKKYHLLDMHCPVTGFWLLVVGVNGPNQLLPINPHIFHQLASWPPLLPQVVANTIQTTIT